MKKSKDIRWAIIESAQTVKDRAWGSMSIELCRRINDRLTTLLWWSNTASVFMPLWDKVNTSDTVDD